MPSRHAMPKRLERRSRSISLTPVIALTILAAGLAFAQQNVPAPAAEPATDGEDAPAAAAAAGDAGQADDAPAAKPAAAKGSPQRFEPTEKVRPDFDVAFPVDI
jgi:hypothetical protein